MNEAHVHPPAPDLHPLLARLVYLTHAAVLDAEGFDDWARQPGVAMVVFAEDPDRYKETLDLAVVVPELHATGGRHFRVGLLPPAASRAVAPRFGFARWPAFVMLRDGHYLGAVDGIRDWDVYTAELLRLLAAAPTRAPTVGIPVKAAGAPEASDPSSCH
ncbi:MAG: hydrogenase [Leptothrix sp. (in: Bacteria)]|nr:hydrogenase [Leptothrix sp. (in: b-proteobacteria)]